jgi:hypothetical protein
MSSCVVMVKSSRPWRALSVVTSALMRGGRDAFLVRQVDLHHAVAVVEFERAGGRDVGGVVEVDAEELSLGFEDADDAKLQIADAHARAQRIFRAEQFFLELGAENDEGARVFRVLGIGRNWPLLTLMLIHLEHVGADAIDRRAPQASVGLDLGIAPDGRPSCR